MKLYDNQVHQEKGSMLIDDYHCVQYAKTWSLSDPRFPAYGQNHIRISLCMDRACHSVHVGENADQRKPVF